MRIVATADLHGQLPEIPPCDLLIVAGDWSHPLFEWDYWQSRGYVESTLTSWLRDVPAKHKVGIAGNHDFIADEAEGVVRGLPWTYLHDETVEIEGFKIHGSPWSPVFGEWAFERPETGLDEKWSLIPGDVDILVTHCPPAGIGDETMYVRSAGSVTLRQHLARLPRLKLHVFGHIHESAGVITHGDVCFINGAYTNLALEPVNPPFEVDLFPRKGE